MSHHRNNDNRNNYRPEPEQGYGYPPLREDYQPKDRRDRGGYDDRGRDGGRDRDRDRDRDRRRDRSRDRRRSRSRSESPPVRTGRRRPTFFDILPAGMTPGAPPPPAVLPGAQPNLAAAAAFAAPPPSLAPMMGNPAAPGPPGFGAAAGSSAAVSQQATRHARRIYVGGLPPTATDTSISSFFGHALAAIGGNTAGPGNAVVNVYINREKNFAFVELRTVEETSNAMALDGIMFEGVSVRVRRPNDYNPAAAASLGPSTPNPNLNLAAIGLSNSNVGGGGGGGGGKPSHIDHPDRIFVGGLPYHLTEEQCRELLGSFGAIKAFDLVKDRDTGLGKGYGFVVYQDSAVTDIACAGLNGLRIGDRTLTVRRATEGPGVHPRVGHQPHGGGGGGHGAGRGHRGGHAHRGAHGRGQRRRDRRPQRVRGHPAGHARGGRQARAVQQRAHPAPHAGEPQPAGHVQGDYGVQRRQLGGQGADCHARSPLRRPRRERHLSDGRGVLLRAVRRVGGDSCCTTAAMRHRTATSLMQDPAPQGLLTAPREVLGPGQLRVLTLMLPGGGCVFGLQGGCLSFEAGASNLGHAATAWRACAPEPATLRRRGRSGQAGTLFRIWRSWPTSRDERAGGHGRAGRRRTRLV